MKKITVITPAYNAEKFIKDCILSVKSAQTFAKFEIEHIIVDDCSTDSTLEVIKQNEYPELKVYTYEQNHGPSFARNFAVEKSDSDYIFFIDADDVIFQNSLRYLFEFAEANKSDWVYGDFLRSDNNLQYKIGDDFYGYSFEDSNAVLKSMLLNNHFFQQNSLFSRSAYTKTGGFDIEVKGPEDFDFCIRLLLQDYYPLYMNIPLYIHRFHDANLSAPNKVNWKIHLDHIKKFYLKYQPKIQEKLSISDINEIEVFLNLN